MNKYNNENLHLFLNDEEIKSSKNTGKVLEAVEDMNYYKPMLFPEHAWEGKIIFAYGSVIYNPEKCIFQMWYTAVPAKREGGNDFLICYAESSDGIIWKKPFLKIYEYNGSKENNVCFGVSEEYKNDYGFVFLDSPCIAYDDSSSENEKYKMSVFIHSENPENNGIWTATSADGLKWDNLRLALKGVGDRSALVFEPQSRLWVIISRYYTGFGRTIAISKSADFLNWSLMEPIMDIKDYEKPRYEYYNMYPFKYGSAYIGFLEYYDTYNLRLDTRLVSSKDFIHWDLSVASTCFLGIGFDASWKEGWVNTLSNAPIAVGDDLYIYYNGKTGAHAGKKNRTGSIGLCKIRKDRFVGIASGVSWGDKTISCGEIITKRVLVGGHKLIINGCAYELKNENQNGYIKVELLDEKGKLIDGYDIDNCIPLRDDSLDYVVHWNDKKDLNNLYGREIHLKIHLLNSKIYSYRFED